ncbi:hypothetical protein ABWK22_02560 [Gottfriedia acidiceleris]|uniref:hypothetical protein n=1 Tax=Gottfriedia acidiceleris TaxID=371036 RepID=UPI0033994E52
MALPIAQGQISIIDYNDAPTLSAFISVPGSKSQIYDPATGATTPDWTTSSPVLTPTLYVSTKGNVDQISSAEVQSVTWYDSVAPTTPLTTGGAYVITGNTLKIVQNTMTALILSKTYIVEIVWKDPNTNDNLAIRADIVFTRISNGATGQSAVTAVLSNETHTVPTDEAGNNPSLGGALTTMSVFVGSTDDSANWTVAKSNETGMTGTLSGKTYTVTGITANNAYVDLTASKSGQPSITKRFVVVKNKQGISSVNYAMNVDAKIIQKSVTGTLAPASLNVTMTSQSNNGIPAAYVGRLSVEEHDGTSWATKYTSSANEATTGKNYVPTATAKQVRVRMYVKDVAVVVGTNVLDEEVIQIVSDGAAVTSILSNDTQSVPTLADGSGGVFTGSTVSTQMSVFVGSTDDSANWTYTLAPAPVGATAVFQGSTAGTVAARSVNVTGMSADTATINITATRSGYPTQVKTFSVNKNKQGIQGIQGLAANQYWLAVDTTTLSTISTGSARTYAPLSINITAKTQSGSNAAANYNGRIVVSEYAGSTWTDKLTGSADTTTWPLNYVPTPQATSAITQVRIRLYAAGGVTNLLDEQIIPILQDGNAITGVLSNEAQSVPTDSAGIVVGGFPTVTTTMSIFIGTVDDSANWSVTAGTPSGLTGSLSGKTYTVSGLTADNAYVDLTATKSGFSSVTKRFAVNKNKQGVSATAYWLLVPPAIGKNVSGVYSPTAITTISAKSQVGSAAAGNYSGRFVIEESTDGGTTWLANSNKYTSAADESSVARFPVGTGTFTAGTNKIRVSLYQAGGTSNLLDQEIISVVSDGATGASAVNLMSYTPSGNVFKNDLYTSLSAQADLYVGSSIQASGVTWEWFIQKTGNADEGAGAGWDKIDSTNQADYGVTGAVNTNTLTVTAASVLNITPFRVKATYSGKSYMDSVIFIDQTDPILVTVESSNGDKFKNGDVASRLTCQLNQNGQDPDPVKADATTGYKYTYTWSKYNSDGNQDLNFGGTGISTKVGKWIDITSADVKGKALFKVEIS